MRTVAAVPAPLLSRYRCAYCGLRVAVDELAHSLWVEDRAASEQQLYHTRCWLAWRTPAQ